MAGRRAKVEPVEEEGWIWGNNRGGEHLQIMYFYGFYHSLIQVVVLL
jgi:hypothetical protein